MTELGLLILLIAAISALMMLAVTGVLIYQLIDEQRRIRKARAALKVLSARPPEEITLADVLAVVGDTPAGSTGQPLRDLLARIPPPNGKARSPSPTRS